ncbi:MAG: ATP phosphoribosyltransferase regulatory subunit, partial [Candidatus Saccharibacteria bacterium]|nr:ATP phosphoribosyltransferase regulatory subunit [Candidatus Saccharibacteria bacterium]
MKISTQPYKGARDFYPEDKAFQKWMFDKWRKVAELYGYVEYDAPILEPTDLYLIKGSQEIIENQTYTFKDRGDRSVTIRTEMTPSVSRMVAGRRQELAYPARWYSIPNLWRYERMQKGRLREFWQLNVDIFGIASESAELEAIQIIDDIFQAFKAKRSAYEIKINSRILVNEMLNSFGLSQEDSTKVIRLIDRLNKMTSEEFGKELNDITKSSDVSSKVVSILNSKKLEDLPENLLKIESVKSMQRILDECSAHGIRNAVFDISLMRGFDYYTDIVFVMSF